VVNLDRNYVQSGWINLQVHRLGIKADETYHVHDLLTGARYQWRGYWNYVQLDPASEVPAHIFRVERDTK
jgi:starch synthase (maltosyl-transferring)